MTNSTTTEFENPNTRTKNVVKVAITLTVLFVGTFIMYLYLALTTGAWQLYVLTFLTGALVLMDVSAIHYSRKNRPEIAATLMIVGPIIVFPTVVTFVSGIGMMLGIGGFAGIFMIATLTLNRPHITRANIAGALMGIGVILWDNYIPFERLEIQLLIVFVHIAAVATLGMFTHYTSQQFSNYPFRTKLIILFIMVAAISVGTTAIITNTLVRNEITRQVGRNQQVLAERLAFEISKELESQVETLQAAAAQFEDTANAANAQYSGSNEQINNRILELDHQWRTLSEQSPAAQAVLNNIPSNELQTFQNHFPNHIELVLTDKYGATIATTYKTPDYYQADKTWWKSAYSLGQGRVYISQPTFNETKQTYTVTIALPIFANNEIVGILQSTSNVLVIFENIQKSEINTNTTIDLRTTYYSLLSGETIALDELAGLNSVLGKYGEINYKGHPSFVSQQRVFSSANSSAQNSVSLLGWSIIVHENVKDALKPVQQQTRTITIVALGITLLAALTGLIVSERLASPITALTKAAGEITEGNLAARAQIHSQDEIGALANAFNRMTSQLHDTLGSLERRVAERTTDLDMARLISERRAQELQSISEISRIISTEQKFEALLPLIARLVSERFDFYHVGIFFVDESRHYAYLQAANSEGGQRMLARGHRLEIGTGLVGTVAQTGKPRIALDVGSDATFFNNPDLPNTRSEMAIPLNIHGHAIGVLDVQSTKPGAFTESDANTLGILGDQVAIAIENARLFTQSQQAREEAEALYAQILHKEWGAFTQQETKIGYRQTATGGKQLTQTVENGEIREAIEKGKVVVMEGKDIKSPPSIAIPVKLRGQTIGVLNIKSSSKARKWSDDEVTLAQAVSDRLAIALDNARLLQESQRRAAKEAKIGEVSAKIGASIDMHNVLQTAVEELGRALPGSEVIIQFQSEQDQAQ